MPPEGSIPAPSNSPTPARQFIRERADPASLEYRMLEGYEPEITEITERLEELKKARDVSSDYRRIATKWLKAQRALLEAEGDV